METRFPISKDKGHVMMSFTWYDAFRASKRAEQYSIHFEKAAVMFNLGAVLTQQALACDRTQDAGMKDAAKKFQVSLEGLNIAQIWSPFLNDCNTSEGIQTLWQSRCTIIMRLHQTSAS